MLLKKTTADLLLKRHNQIWTTCSAVLRSAIFSSAIAWGIAAATAPPAQAQIAGDGSIGTEINGNPIAPCITGSCLITGGTRATNALFHSFSQFSIPTGSEAVFDAAGAQAIFARVTGGFSSAIDGRIATLGPDRVHLFLLNPNGFIFGPNAVLNIGGSFVASTASSIVFDNGARFSATDRTFSPPLLTINVPIGLQFGPNPAPILVQGTGNNLFLNPANFEIVRDFRPPGLEVLPGETLALMGGEIRLEGGNLTASQGRVELGSLGSDSLVSLMPTGAGWYFSYGGVQQFQDIHLTQAASIDASGNGGGNIQVQGRRVTLTDASVILTDTLGEVAGGELTIRADSLEVKGISEIAPLYSGILADSASTATGRGGNIFLETGHLAVTEGAQIGANTFGVGDAGTLTIRSGSITLDGGSFLGPSGLFSSVAPEATGAGGSLDLTAQRLQITTGAQVAATSFGLGATGNLTINANEMELAGVFADPEIGEQPSAVSVDMLEDAIGQGGNLSIQTNRLRIAGGAQISSGTFGAGNAGSIRVQAEDIEISGGATSFVSGILAPVDLNATGRGGAIALQTERLTITDGGQIATSTAGVGDAGNLVVNASDLVRLTGRAAAGRSGLFASAVSGTGSGGNLSVTADRLIVENGATISVSNFPSTLNSPFSPGQGSAGNLNVNARSVLLNNQATLTADTAAGDRGNIGVQTNLLVLRRGSQISTNATGTASGGNIRIETPNGFIVAVPKENSDITANAVQGNGGRVDITAKGIYGIQVRPRLTPLSDITASSDFGVAGVVTLNTPDLDTVRGLLQVVENPSAPALLQGCQPGQGASVSRFSDIGRGGSRPHPTDSLSSRNILGDVSLPEAWIERTGVNSGTSTDPAISTPKRTVKQTAKQTSDQTPIQIVEAQGWIVNERGEIFLVAEVPPPGYSAGCVWQTRFQPAAPPVQPISHSR